MKKLIREAFSTNQTEKKRREKNRKKKARTSGKKTKSTANQTIRKIFEMALETI